MPKLAGDHVQVLVDGYELTGDSNRININEARDLFDITAFGDEAHKFSPGQRMMTVQHAGLMNSGDGSSHPVLEGVDVSGLERAHGKTFRWTGRYRTEDVNVRDTLDLQLNVFDGFNPILNTEQSQVDYLFLGNLQPELQLQTLAQMESRPKLVAADTIAIWIETKREELTEVLKSVDVVFMDEGEVRSFASEPNLMRAAGTILELGPSVVVAKRGEHGVLMLMKDSVFAAPAFPLDGVADPTGAGDSFAGGFMGYLAQRGDLSGDNLRRAAVVGSVMGSFTVQALSVEKLSSLNRGEIVERLRGYVALTSFEGLRSEEDLPWRE